jgi:hypothetical protein
MGHSSSTFQAIGDGMGYHKLSEMKMSHVKKLVSEWRRKAL